MTTLLIVIGMLVVTFGFTAFVGAPYVPSRRRLLKKAFSELYPVSKRDVVVDFGSGDGVVLREVARRGGRAIGLELHFVFVIISRLLSRRYKNVEVRWVNAWTTPFPDDTTLVYIFSVSRDSKRLTKKLKTEANRLGRSLSVLTFGSRLYNEQPIKTLDAYSLYDISPLQAK